MQKFTGLYPYCQVEKSLICWFPWIKLQLGQFSVVIWLPQFLFSLTLLLILQYDIIGAATLLNGFGKLN